MLDIEKCKRRKQLTLVSFGIAALALLLIFSMGSFLIPEQTFLGLLLIIMGISIFWGARYLFLDEKINILKELQEKEGNKAGLQPNIKKYKGQRLIAFILFLGSNYALIGIVVAFITTLPDQLFSATLIILMPTCIMVGVCHQYLCAKVDVLKELQGKDEDTKQ